MSSLARCAMYSLASLLGGAACHAAGGGRASTAGGAGRRAGGVREAVAVTGATGGIVERLSTGEKAHFQGVEALTGVIAEMFEAADVQEIKEQRRRKP